MSQYPSTLAGTYGDLAYVSTYEPLTPTTEMVTHTYTDGHVITYRQRWAGGLAAAPAKGEVYVVDHEEWRRGSDGIYCRTIHAWTLKGNV